MDEQWINLARFALTLLLGFACGYALMKLHIPGGMLVGAIVGAAIANLVFDYAYVPYAGKFLAQAIAGAFVGCSINREFLHRLPSIAKPLLLVMASLLVTTAISGCLIYQISSWSFITSFLCCTPGGMTEIPLVALDMGADGDKVAALQFARLLLGVVIIPCMLHGSARRRANGKEAAHNVKTTAGAMSIINGPDWIILAAALIGGMIGRWIGIPAGIIIVSMVFSALARLLLNKGGITIGIKRIAQLLSGTYIGASIHHFPPQALLDMLIPIGILLSIYSINSLLTGKCLMKVCGYEKKMAIMAATPAGSSDMALIASDLGIADNEIVILQIFRMILVVTVFPPLIGWFSSLPMFSPI